MFSGLLKIRDKVPDLDVDMKHMKERTMSRMFSRANSILTGKNVLVDVKFYDAQYPNWLANFEKTMDVWANDPDGKMKLISGGCEVKKNEKNTWEKLNQVNLICHSEDLLTLKGLNYHELGHIFFTRFAEYETQRLLNDDKLFKAMNILEDARVETYMGTKYDKSVKAYLRVLRCRMTERNIKMKNIIGFGWYTTFYGVKTLPTKIAKVLRQMIRRKYDEPVVRAAEKIVDKYVIAKSSTERMNLVYEYRKLLDDNNIDEGELPKFPTTVPANSDGSDALDDYPEQLTNELKRIKKAVKASDKDVHGKSAQNVDELKDIAGKKKKNSDRSDEECKGGKESESDGTGGYSKDAKGTLEDLTIHQINRLFEDQVHALENYDMPRVEKDLDATITSLLKSDVPEHKCDYGSWNYVTPNMRKASKEMIKLIKMIKKTAYTPHKRKTSGKLDLRLAMKSKINGKGKFQSVKIFQNKEMSQGIGTFRVAVVIDISSSMDDAVAYSLQILAWEIWNAVTTEGGHCTVTLYNSESHPMQYEANRFTGLSVTGGTDMLTVRPYLTDMFNTAFSAEEKMVILLTDAEYMGSYVEVADYLKVLHDKANAKIWVGCCGRRSDARKMLQYKHIEGAWIDLSRYEHKHKRNGSAKMATAAYNHIRQVFMRFLKDVYRKVK